MRRKTRKMYEDYINYIETNYNKLSEENIKLTLDIKKTITQTNNMMEKMDKIFPIIFKEEFEYGITFSKEQYGDILNDKKIGLNIYYINNNKINCINIYENIELYFDYRAYIAVCNDANKINNDIFIKIELFLPLGLDLVTEYYVLDKTYKKLITLEKNSVIFDIIKNNNGYNLDDENEILWKNINIENNIINNYGGIIYE